MAAMQKAGIKRLRIKEKTGYEIELEREDKRPKGFANSLENPPVYHHPVPPSFREYHTPITHAPASESKVEPVKENGRYITSPMVGTFYAAASPDHPAFVKVGDKVEENTVVCIIEAMKVMNEVKAGMSGVIAETMVTSGHPLEFGAKLFKIV